MADPKQDKQPSDIDTRHEGRDDYFMDIDRMINEGLGGGNVTINNGLIEETTTDSMLDSETVREDVESES